MPECGSSEIIRAWMMGHPVLCDPLASVGHRFITEFSAYDEKLVDLAANQLRLARKLFSPSTLASWLKMRGLDVNGPVNNEHDVWTSAWAQFAPELDYQEESAKRFQFSRVANEFEYARQMFIKLAGARENCS